MKLDYIDTHMHLNFDVYDDDRDYIIEQMREQRVGGLVIGVSAATSQETAALAGEYDHLWATAGVHPLYADEVMQGDLEQIDELAQMPRVVGIGECGVDYFRTGRTPEMVQLQMPIFRRQIEMAIAHDLPMVLHIRASKGSFDAYEDVLEVLAQYKEQAPSLRGVAHFFAGTTAHADRFLALGFDISVTGVITFTDDYNEVIRHVPADRIHAETDAPYVAPVPYRGARAEPLHVMQVAMRQAQLRGVGLDEWSGQLMRNAERLWGIEVR